MRITAHDAPPLPAPPRSVVPAGAPSTLWLLLALIGAVATVGTPYVLPGVVVAAIGCYLLGVDAGRKPDPRVAALTRANAELQYALLRRDGAAPRADRPAEPEAGEQHGPLGVLRGGRRRGGFDAAAAVDALDAPLPGEDPRAVEAE